MNIPVLLLIILILIIALPASGWILSFNRFEKLVGFIAMFIAAAAIVFGPLLIFGRIPR